VQDALVAFAQNSTRVCIYQQPHSGVRFTGQPQVSFMNQRDFDGRLKMYRKEESGNFASKVS
jgi:hypothetical protein